ncbi:MAG: SDR family oxidoreductase [Spirochaetia bacterium]|nr:SDR family oxidoreductase [Spirochaetia bacterium]
MKGKKVMITGGNSGIGKETAIGLAKLGATVVIACRSQERGNEAVADIKRVSGNANVFLILMDLASQKSVREAAEEYKRQYKELHVLINNAAVFLPKREETEEGIEKTFAINYLSHFLLTHLLLDTLKASAPSRVINTASKHMGIKMNFDDLMTTQKYSFFKAVGPTKLGLIMFSKVLAKKLEGTGVTVNAIHPGLAKSNLLNQMPFLVRFLFGLIMTSSEKCAKTGIHLASAPELEKVSGRYFENSKEVKAGANATNESDNQKLWDLSVKLAKVG